MAWYWYIVIFYALFIAWAFWRYFAPDVEQRNDIIFDDEQEDK